MGRSRYPQELREPAVRMVFEHQDEPDSQWSAIRSIASKFGDSTEALRKWVRRAEFSAPEGGAAVPRACLLVMRPRVLRRGLVRCQWSRVARRKTSHGVANEEPMRHSDFGT